MQHHEQCDRESGEKRAFHSLDLLGGVLDLKPDHEGKTPVARLTLVSTVSKLGDSEAMDAAFAELIQPSTPTAAARIERTRTGLAMLRSQIRPCVVSRTHTDANVLSGRCSCHRQSSFIINDVHAAMHELRRIT